MKKLITMTLAGAIAVSSMSCQTTYDAYGNPRQTVDPTTAVAGVAAAGVLGYAIANKKRKDDRYDNHQGRYNNRGYYDHRGRYDNRNCFPDRRDYHRY